MIQRQSNYYHSLSLKRALALSLTLFTVVLYGCSSSETTSTTKDCPEPQPGFILENSPWKSVARRGEAAGVPYLEVLFNETNPSAKLPLIVAIHGMGDRARVPVGAIEMLDKKVRVVIPDGPIPHHGGFAWTLYRVKGNRHDRLARDLRAQSARLAAMIRELLQKMPTRGAPIVLGGSQGGMLTFALALHHPEVVGHAFPLMGWLPPTLVPTRLKKGVRYPPIRSIHGYADEVVPIAPTQKMVKKLRELGLTIELVHYAGIGHFMSMPMEEKLHRWIVEALDN